MFLDMDRPSFFGKEIFSKNRLVPRQKGRHFLFYFIIAHLKATHEALGSFNTVGFYSYYFQEGSLKFYWTLVENTLDISVQEEQAETIFSLRDQKLYVRENPSSSKELCTRWSFESSMEYFYLVVVWEDESRCDFIQHYLRSMCFDEHTKHIIYNEDCSFQLNNEWIKLANERNAAKKTALKNVEKMPASQSIQTNSSAVQLGDETVHIPTMRVFSTEILSRTTTDSSKSSRTEMSSEDSILQSLSTTRITSKSLAASSSSVNPSFSRLSSSIPRSSPSLLSSSSLPPSSSSLLSSSSLPPSSSSSLRPSLSSSSSSSSSLSSSSSSSSSLSPSSLHVLSLVATSSFTPGNQSGHVSIAISSEIKPSKQHIFVNNGTSVTPFLSSLNEKSQKTKEILTTNIFIGSSVQQQSHTSSLLRAVKSFETLLKATTTLGDNNGRTRNLSSQYIFKTTTSLRKNSLSTSSLIKVDYSNVSIPHQSGSFTRESRFLSTDLPTTASLPLNSRILISPWKPLLHSSSQVVTEVKEPVGMFAEWTEWSSCSSPCLNGTKRRERVCVFLLRNFTPSYDEGLCLENETEYSSCSEFSKCTDTKYYLATGGLSCENFCQNKSLACSTELVTGDSSSVFYRVLPKVFTVNEVWVNNYGPYCLDKVCSEFKKVPEALNCEAVPPTKDHRRLCLCSEKKDLGFGSWSPWSGCSATCEGINVRTRECFDNCIGEKKQTSYCGTTKCPVHGGLSLWSSWSTCSRLCGGGATSRRRLCNNPTPAYSGFDCVGNTYETLVCNTQFCPVDGHVREWSLWSGCNKPCNNGTTSRFRVCVKPKFEGKPCLPVEEQRWCNGKQCPETYAGMELHFRLAFSERMANQSSEEFKELEKLIANAIINVLKLDFAQSINNVRLLNVSEGSVIANMLLNFTNFDSYQFISFQDSAEIFRSFDGLLLVSAPTFYDLGPSVPTLAPTNFIVIPDSSTSFQLLWNPVINSLLPVLGYIVFYRPTMRNVPYEAVGSSGQSARLIGLKPGTEYMVRVLAFTENGNGVASRQVIVATNESMPDAYVRSLVLTAQDANSILLEWTPADPDEMNGFPLGYHVRMYIGRALKTSTDVRFSSDNQIVDELYPSTTYIFDVCPFNKVGEGPCARSSATTFSSRPSSAPQQFTVAKAKTHDSVFLRWQPPPSDTLYGDMKRYRVFYQRIKRAGSELDEFESPREVFLHPKITSLELRDLQSYSVYSIELTALTEAGESPSAILTAETCRCAEKVTSNYAVMSPYVTEDTSGDITGVFPLIINEMIAFACGECERPSSSRNSSIDLVFNGRHSYAKKPSQMKMYRDIDQFTDISFPINGQLSLDTFLGYPYVPLLQHPGIVMISREPPLDQVVYTVIRMIFGIWPLIAINFLMMILSGAIVWFLDMAHFSGTKGTFSQHIVKGISDAVYFAWVTQGTTGYGDYIPKRMPTKIVAMIWILAGIVMTSLIVGSIVTALLSVNAAAVVQIYGSEIGAVNGSYEQRVGLLRNGHVNSKRQYDNIAQLSHALKTAEVQAILVDAYSAGSNRETLKDPLIQPTEFIQTVRTYGFVLSGDLINVHAEVRDYIATRQKHILEIVSNTTYKMQEVSDRHPHSLFDPRSVVLHKTLITLVAMLVVFSLIGWLVPWLRRRKRGKCSYHLINNYRERKKKLEHVQKFLEEFKPSLMERARVMLARHAHERVKLQIRLSAEKSIWGAISDLRSNKHRVSLL